MRRPTKTETTHALTEAALAHMEHVAPEDYNPTLPLGNPLADSTQGQSYNWDKNLVPTNAVRFIRSFDSIAEGVAKTAEHAIDALLEYSPETTIAPFVIMGVVKAIAGRFGVGAMGERLAAEVLGATDSALEGDENAGIDLRAGDRTYQVKTAEDRRSDWDEKDAETLIWVEIGPSWEVHEL